MLSEVKRNRTFAASRKSARRSRSGISEPHSSGLRVLCSLPQWGKVPSEAEADEVLPPPAAFTSKERFAFLG